MTEDRFWGTGKHNSNNSSRRSFNHSRLNFCTVVIKLTAQPCSSAIQRLQDFSGSSLSPENESRYHKMISIDGRQLVSERLNRRVLFVESHLSVCLDHLGVVTNPPCGWSDTIWPGRLRSEIFIEVDREAREACERSLIRPTGEWWKHNIIPSRMTYLYVTESNGKDGPLSRTKQVSQIQRLLKIGTGLFPRLKA